MPNISNSDSTHLNQDITCFSEHALFYGVNNWASTRSISTGISAGHKVNSFVTVINWCVHWRV